MAEPTLRIPSEGLAVERRGAIAKIARVALAIELLGFSAAVWRFAAVDEPAPGSLLALVVALMAALVTASIVIRHRFDPARSAAVRARSRGELTLGREGLSIATRRLQRAYAPGSIADGWIDDAGEVVSVVLRMRDGDVISIETPTLREARELLRAAGVAAEQQVLRMRLANPMSQVPVGGCIAAFGSLVLPIVLSIALIVILAAPPGDTARGVAVLIFAAATLVLGLLVRALIPRQVVIGTDGIAVERMFGRTFIAHARVTDVVSTAGAVVLQIKGERSVWLPTGSRYSSARTRAEESPHSALLNRIDEARAAGRHGSSRDARVAGLERAGRSLEAWRQHLRGLVAAASYRRAGVVSEEIATVLDDAGAPPLRRVAAAVALAPVGDPAIKHRIARVVQSCADDRLRVALEAAVSDELTDDDLSPLLRKQRR
ncbi:MAG: hypothetical protein ABJE95_25515 [Byssovorax sp.]